MKTINLGKESPSVVELLAMASKKAVLLVSKDGTAFVLEEANEFDREVAEFGGSKKFMEFLGKRSKEPAVTSIEELVGQLIQATHNTTLQATNRARRKSKPKKSPRAARG